MENFKILERGSEVGITAQGVNLEQVFAHAAHGMFSLMADLTNVDEKEQIEIKQKGNNLEEMLFNFLDQLLYRFEVNNFLAKRVEVRKCTPRLLEAVAYGEEKDKTHRIKREIRSVTYHKLKIKQLAGFWKIQVGFDT